jgi:hypothetical protein
LFHKNWSAVSLWNHGNQAQDVFHRCAFKQQMRECFFITAKGTPIISYPIPSYQIIFSQDCIMMNQLNKDFNLQRYFCFPNEL